MVYRRLDEETAMAIHESTKKQKISLAEDEEIIAGQGQTIQHQTCEKT